MSKKLPEYEKPNVVDLDEARRNLEAEAEAGREKIDEEINEILARWDESWRRLEEQQGRLEMKWKRRGRNLLLLVWGGAMLVVLGIIIYLFYLDAGGIR